MIELTALKRVTERIKLVRQNVKMLTFVRVARVEELDMAEKQFQSDLGALKEGLNRTNHWLLSHPALAGEQLIELISAIDSALKGEEK